MMSHLGISRRRRLSVFVETIERRILFSGNIATLSNFGTFDVAQGATVVDSRGDIFGTTQANSGAFGTLYELPAGENTIETLVTFTGNNGSDPGSFLTMDPSGNIYGTTAAGGQDGAGIIWELPANASGITRLVSYDGTDGNQLGNGLARDTAGNIYVIGEAGSNGNGALLELPAGATSLSVIATFAAGDDPVGRPVVDLAGDVFAATAAGGTNGLGTLDELPANRSAFNTIVPFTAANPTPQGDLLIDSAGDVFGTTVNSSDNQTLSTIYEVPANSIFINTLLTHTSIDGSYLEPGLVRDSAGNLFGSAVGAISAPSSVFELPIIGGAFSSAVTLATIPEVGNGATNTNAATGFLALDASGNLYGTTQSTAPGTSDTLFEIPGAGVPQVGSQLLITSQPSQTIVSNVIAPSIVVDVLDSNNNLVLTNTSPVSVRIATGPTGASLGGTLTVNAVNGVANFSNLNLNTTGTYTFSFTAPGMSSATTNTFRIIPSPLDGSHLVFTLPPTPSTVAGTKLQEFIVSAEQASNAISTKTKGTVTLSITSGPTNGKILGTKTAPLVKGVAIFKKVSFDIAGTYTLEASDTASVAATPDTFNITATTPKKMIFGQQPAAKIASNQTFAVSVETKDKYGNLATNDDSSVTLVLSGSSKLAVLDGTLTENIVDGIAAFDDLSLITTGHYVLKASDPSDNLKVSSKGFKIT
jgi:hypothetical protein